MGEKRTNNLLTTRARALEEGLFNLRLGRGFRTRREGSAGQGGRGRGEAVGGEGNGLRGRDG